MDRLAVMETFVRVVETKSFSAAAKFLNVGQPAVSKSIAQLERRLRVRLLMRSTRGLMLTEAGRNFYERARRAIQEADEADLAARGAGADLVGHLRVSAGEAFGSLHIVPRLPAFMAAHPNLEVDLILQDRPLDLLEECIDLAIRTWGFCDHSLTAHKIAAGRHVVVGTPTYFEQAGIPNTPAELTTHTAIIHAHPSGGDTWSFRRGASEVSVDTMGRLRVSAAPGVRAAVLAGMGFAIASEWMFAPELRSGAVRTVLGEWTLPAADVWAVFPLGRIASAKGRAFAAFMEAEFQSATSAREAA